MAWPEVTSINASSGLDSFLPYLNTVTNYWFGRMFIIAIFVIFLFGYIRYKNEDWIGAFAVASYVTFVLGLIFWVINIITGTDFGIIIGITAISSVILFTQHKEGM